MQPFEKQQIQCMLFSQQDVKFLYLFTWLDQILSSFSLYSHTETSGNREVKKKANVKWGHCSLFLKDKKFSHGSSLGKKIILDQISPSGNVDF